MPKNETLPALTRKIMTMSDYLNSLRMLRILTKEKDELILGARLAGASWEEICEVAGMSRQTVTEAAKRANGGVVPSVGRVNKG